MAALQNQTIRQMPVEDAVNVPRQAQAAAMQADSIPTPYPTLLKA
jgi:hypothetical protein